VARDQQEFAAICRELVGQTPDSIEAPGGESRDSMRARFGEQSLIVTHRKHLQRARLEALVLRVLNQAEAPAPRLIAWREHWLLQQDLGAVRLTEKLDGLEPIQAQGLLDQSLSTLILCQRAAHEAGLSQKLVSLGANRPWFDKLFSRREAVASNLNLSAPAIPADALAEQLRLREPRFVKWDARPGNAVVNRRDEICWIDWEHAGCRNGIDDMVWLLADEYTPTDAETERQLVEGWVQGFGVGWQREEALDYFYTYGVLHSLVRLDYILRYKDGEEWWDHQRCLRLDKVGVTHHHAMRVAQRIRRWAAQSSLLGDWSAWLEEVENAIPA
jgi:hypothetical protein